MRAKIEFVLLGAVGGLLVVIATYTQWVSTDLSKHSLKEYVTGAYANPEWWSIVGIPLLSGIAFVVAAAFGATTGLKQRAAVIFFVGCEIFAVLLIPIGGVGYIAAVLCTLVLIYVGLKHGMRSS